MIAVLLMLTRGSSRAERVRAWLVGTGAAAATFLVCTAVSLADFEDEGGSLTGLGLALLAVPVAGLVHQANRLASATRERRLAALRLAGATPGDVRRLGALEGGLLALAGSLTGGALYVVTHLGGPLPQIPVVVALVTLGGVLSGARAGRHVVVSPLGATRRARVRGPRVQDLLLLAAGVGLFVLGAWLKGRFPLAGPYGAALAMVAGLVMMLFGLTLATTWLIRAYARRAGRRARSPETLLAARLVEADPRAWARALSVVSLTVFFGAAAGAQQASVGYSQAHALVDVALLLALATSSIALVVHQAEELIDRRRSFAALAAAGVPERALGGVLVRQAVVAALPVCVVAAVSGVAVVVLTVVTVYRVESLPWALTRAVLMAGVGVLAAMVVALAARPLLRGALRSGTRT
ncbi:FtsX-like permease family protein [Nonomuraea sp. NPDC004702]